MTKRKQIFRQKYLCIGIQTLCCETHNWAQVHPVSIDHPWDVSTSWLESTCGKFNWLVMIWKGTHLSIYGPTVDSACQSKKQAMRLKELSVELQDRIGSRHRSEDGYQHISAELKVPKNTVAIIIKWKKFGTTKILPRVGQTEQSGEKGLGQVGDQDPDGHYDRAPECLCGDGRTFQKYTCLCSTPPIWPLW